MPHDAPRGIYSDYSDLMRQFDMQHDDEQHDQNTLVNFGVMAADFYIGVQSRFSDDEEGHDLAMTLASFFVDNLTRMLVTIGGANNAGEG